jgi:sugar transferase (PEP-CTERM system associated)
MLSVVRHSFTPRIAATVCFEVFALNFLFWSQPFPVFVGTDPTGALAESSWAIVTVCALFNTAVVQFSFWSFGLYSREAIYNGAKFLRDFGLALAFSLALAVPTYFLFHLSMGEQLALSPATMGTVLLEFVSLVALERYVILRVFANRTYLGNVIILGTGNATSEAIRETCQGSHGDVCRFVAVLDTEESGIGTSVHGCPVAGTVDQIRDFVDYRDANTIIISLPRHSDHLPTDYLINCKLAGVRVLYVGEFYESVARRVLLEDFTPLDFLYRRNLVMTQFRWLTKSIFEKTAALLLLIPSIPVMIFAAIMVRISSPGPILYRQVRTGQGGEPFTLLKFRSMSVDAEKDGATWAQQNDPRVTSWGRIMRKTRIDELPQILNVLRGEMSFVGPRPERPEVVEQLEQQIPHYSRRHLVRPGVTGWAQVAFHYGGTIEGTEEKLRYDLYYIKHMSIGFDLLIILNTVRTVLYNGGAR